MPIKYMDVAISEIGTAEVTTNWGSPKDPSDVDDFLRSVGINFPAAWCMAFVYWCCKQADPNVPLVKTGGVMRQWNEIDPKYKVTKNPRPGDIFIMDYGKGLGHTGFIERVLGDTLYTIEGNTNDDGSREGYKVCRRQRKVSSCKGFIRLYN